ncbi:MAG: cupin [Desulfuromonas sp.]|nr:MAG: cupin [Desulfuromonas sp.]
MSQEGGNLFKAIPAALADEVFEEIVSAETVRIERILSHGHTSPENGWYDQEEHEWVIVLQGCGRLAFADGREVELAAGDYLNIPAHMRHKVVWTDPDAVTLWLAVFYR